MLDIKTELKKELDDYINANGKFEEYYPNMKILTSSLYKKQLESILSLLEEESQGSSKNFKLYLDTVIINMQSKVQKYKKSIFFDNENIKDIENQGYIIPFFIDEQNKQYIILGIVKG